VERVPPDRLAAVRALQKYDPTIVVRAQRAIGRRVPDAARPAEQLVQVDDRIYEYRLNAHHDVISLVSEMTAVDPVRLEYDPYWSRAARLIEADTQARSGDLSG
jgi:hypothetical protein